MKTEVCLMCVVCFVLGWFVHNIVGKCGFGREHLTEYFDCPGGHTANSPSECGRPGHGQGDYAPENSDAKQRELNRQAFGKDWCNRTGKC
jgi:hypothetical protein